VSDRILRASLDAKSAEDTSAVIDVIDFCITLVASDPLLVWSRIILCFDVDAVRRTSCGAQIACDALFLPHLIDVKKMLSTIARLHGDGNVGILHGPFLARDLGDRTLHALDDRNGRLNYV